MVVSRVRMVFAHFRVACRDGVAVSRLRVIPTVILANYYHT